MSATSRWKRIEESLPTSSVNDSSASASPFAPSGDRCRSRIERADPVRRLLLRLADLVELHAHIFGLTLLEELPRDIDLDGEAEQHLREIIVEVPGDLESFVRPFLRHRVRERTEDLLAVLKFLVGFLESLRSEEHLSSKQQGSEDRGQSHGPTLLNRNARLSPTRPSPR